MATLGRGRTYGATETLYADDLHELVDLGSVSGIVNADCAAGMALADTKLAAITTAGKVSGAALTSLANIPSGAGAIPAANLTNATLPTGSILMFGSATPPTGWLNCDGSAVSRTTYSALFAVIGETYGAGDSSTTFNLPSLVDKFARGSATPGTGAGADTHTHSGAEHTHTTPAHTHVLANSGNYAQVAGQQVATASAGGAMYSAVGTGGNSVGVTSTTTSGGSGTSGAGGTEATGSGSNIPAYDSVAYIIKT